MAKVRNGAHFSKSELSLSPLAELDTIIVNNNHFSSDVEIQFEYTYGDYTNRGFVQQSLTLNRALAQDLVDVLTMVLAKPEPEQGQCEVMGDDEIKSIIAYANALRSKVS